MCNDVKVLLVEDSREDATLILEVLKDEKIAADITVVRDGMEALDYLNKKNKYETAERPDVILLDLNLPGLDGRSVLAKIKENPHLKSLPVVILTTSQAEEDIIKSYDLQASCYVTKPIDLSQFVKIIKSIDDFWFTAVRYPPKC